MTLSKSTRKTTAKSAAKTAKKPSVKKPVAKKPEKIDFSTFTVSQAELATLLGLATANITPMVQQGTMVKDADGRFNLLESVSGYVKRMRERKSGAGSKSDLDAELQYWKIEKAKNAVRDFRMNRDREVCLAVLSALTNAMAELKKELGGDPGVGRAIDRFIERVNSVDVDGVSYLVEGDGDEDEDD